MRAIPVGPMLRPGKPGRSFHSGGTFPMQVSPGQFQSDQLRQTRWLQAGACGGLDGLSQHTRHHNHAIRHGKCPPDWQRHRRLLMDSSAQRCAVTGATGYVGSRISVLWDTWLDYFEFRRRPSPYPAPDRVHVPFRLDSPIDPRCFRDNGIRVVIHCAYDFRPVNWEDIRRVNVEGSAGFLRAAKEAGVDRIIFISSISAFDGCSSLYGKANWKSRKSRLMWGFHYPSRPRVRESALRWDVWFSPAIGHQICGHSINRFRKVHAVSCP